ncbi:aspartate aminotransferase [Astrocystis sublimbata]|nr:aspartate aminotransferase [Astrocystis sublimbata]
MFDQIPPGPEDPMFFLKKRADKDSDCRKVDVGVGIYRNEEGNYQELDVIRQAKRILDQLDLGHDYEITTGDNAFLRLAAQVLFGTNSGLLNIGRVSSVQTLSGTGACHLGALLLATNVQPKPKVFVGVPSWGNTVPLFEHVGLETKTYRYLSPNTKRVDMASTIEALRQAPPGSVFSFQGCCQNPLGADFTEEQWTTISQELKARNHLPFIDIAYQGLGKGLHEDAAGLRIITESNPEALVCQSFSKNFALYGERCGVLHVVAKSPKAADNVKDQLRSLIRREFSSSPAYASRLVKIVLEDDNLREQWVSELSEMRHRLQRNREMLYRHLSETFQTPGDWKHIVEDQGLFSCLALTKSQCQILVSQYHIHLPENGRINVAGLNLGNIEYTARSIDAVVRKGVTNRHI